ncbi:MAG: hypothetical protein G01um1014106_174 [Parcubacteria group bacterium Gr01-1014_106]|nr:MAG: hypothetical protein G01um1014106_174 [Parcubacteria group bacterium Gr01-1014_106]
MQRSLVAISVLIVLGLVFFFFLGEIFGYLLGSRRAGTRELGTLPSSSSDILLPTPRPPIHTFADGLSGNELTAALIGKGLMESVINEGENTRTYRSPLGFNFTYPATWVLDPGIERFPSLAHAQSFSANYFQLYNPGGFQNILERESKPSSGIKIEAFVYDLTWPDANKRPLPKNLDEWISRDKDEGIKLSRRIEIGGKEARLVQTEGGYDIVYFVDRNRAVVFAHYIFGKAHEDSDTQTFLRIVRSFNFSQ